MESLPGRPARVSVPLTVEWPDTDAAGHYQNSVVLRWVQIAEAALHERLGIAARTFGSTPRVRFEADFTLRLYFLDRVVMDFWVENLGRTSVRYGFAVRRGDEVATRGSVVSVYMPQERGLERSIAWPDDIRQLLAGAGDVT